MIKIQARLTDPKTAANLFGVSVKSLKRWMAVGPERKKGKIFNKKKKY